MTPNDQVVHKIFTPLFMILQSTMKMAASAIYMLYSAIYSLLGFSKIYSKTERILGLMLITIIVLELMCALPVLFDALYHIAIYGVPFTDYLLFPTQYTCTALNVLTPAIFYSNSRQFYANQQQDSSTIGKHVKYNNYTM